MRDVHDEVDQEDPTATGIPSAPASPATFAPVPAPEAPTARVPTPADDSVTPTPDLPVTPATAEPLPVPINAAVDAQINGIITANSRYQLGMALIDRTPGNCCPIRSTPTMKR